MEPDICSALRKGYFHQIRLLLRLGRDPNASDPSGRTPLQLCAFVEDPRWGVGLARTLLEGGARCGRVDGAGGRRNALHYACALQRAALLRVLLGAVETDLNQPDRFGTPRPILHALCFAFIFCIYIVHLYFSTV